MAVLDEMCAEAGVEIRMLTRVVGAARDSENRLSVRDYRSPKVDEKHGMRKLLSMRLATVIWGHFAGLRLIIGHPETGDFANADAFDDAQSRVAVR